MRVPAVLFILIVLPLFAVTITALAQCPGTGDCLKANDTPGCDNAECCENVCLLVPSCCQVQWDASCVDVADIFCMNICGSSAAGSCFTPNQFAGCNDAECCQTVCAVDPFCCQTQWDASCAAQASVLCGSTQPGTCGDPAAGSCFIANGTPACSNQACCQAVCALVPSCCTAVWDFFCASLANTLCTPGCTVPCPDGATLESELCGQNSNDPCFEAGGGVPQAVTCGETVCGTIFDFSQQPGQLPDVDVFTLNVGGTGKQRVVITFRSAFEGFLALTPAGSCDLVEATEFTDGSDCVPRVLDICVDPGQWWIVVSSGTFPTPGIGNIGCGFGETYRFTVTCSDSCAPVCGNAEGSCFLPQPTPGCGDADCCDAVCFVDPSCCEATWDAICAEEAVGLCDGSKPENDTCHTCTHVGLGAHPFSTIGATTTDLPLPAICDEGFGLSFGQDVWFCHEAVCDGELIIDTCQDTNFDSRLAVYAMGCDGLELVACNDDDPFCIVQERSRLTFDAVCGAMYFVRVGGFADEIGIGTLSFACGLATECTSNCLGDFDGDGVVDGADLGFLLQSWGLTGPADLNGDNIVDGADLGIFLNLWGPCR